MAAPFPSPETALVSGLSAIAERYDLILCDIWGVLHDGLVALPASGEALTRYRDGGGRVVLISNAPRPGPAVAAQLDQFGVLRSAWDDIVTSGDLTRAAVIARGRDPVFLLGPPRDLPLFEGLDVDFAAPEVADYVVCSGLFDDEIETVDDYRGVLALMKRRDLPMICANPDIVVERGDRLVLCAGALGAAYEALGGDVFYPGKPYRPIYEAALAQAARLLGRPAELARVLAVGDAIRTDIAGAAPLGIDTLLVARGIHASELSWAAGGALDQAGLESWLSRQAVRPVSVTAELVWAA